MIKEIILKIDCNYLIEKRLKRIENVKFDSKFPMYFKKSFIKDCEEYLENTLSFGRSYFRDVSRLKLVDKVIAKPNRLVILNARKLHGGYIDDKEKYLGQERFQ